MGPLDALWHLLNFFAPALGVALWVCLLGKLLWRRSLKVVSLPRLLGWTTAAGALALVVGLVVLGRDGRMATYGLLVLATSTTLWWLGPRRG